MNIIIKPIITEKMTSMEDKLNRVAFVVDRRANKIEIANAIKELYGVTPISVNTLIRPGKAKSRYTKSGYMRGRTNIVKKAIITLAEGDKIDFYSNI
ncbi:MAG: 50S ribosomal protein L23 [Bacteroidales bacterium]|nr:50S ribosomal protein L23 [Bacteroidales bacterium]